ncbi:hypothetical protein Acsp06_27640 [Actinomycetospora sp. NBRC 106375]|uniref:hypothetical protein n=1 Tax=Actinomycetospora sp. NBRC 106375 TaxID=3032207 RepID=UPI0024A10625|nr:hypothetical protein [Actinomycetospora sp. NBRC 106375]GLZ46579.1 hypothetical protein Acsp06_27640 [Actinomycetospora sp. NBRC 106375]
MTATAGADQRTGRAAPSADSAAARGWTGADTALAVALFLGAAIWFHWLAAGASTQGVLTGEEASITHRDTLALRLGWQPSVWSTNVGAQLYYWAAGHLSSDYGLFYARPWKALGTALLAPLVFGTARRRLACRRGPAALAAVLTVALPGVSMLAWVAIETPLDVVVGLAALLVVTSSRRGWWAGPTIAGLAVSTYTAGLAGAAAVVLVALSRIRGWRDAVAVAAGVAGGLAIVLAPLAWWSNGGIVVTGGGRAGADPAQAGAHLAEMLGYAVRSGASYYYFSDLPALGGPVIAVVLLAGAAVATWSRPALVWPWAAALGASLVLYAVSSGVPGTRRLVLAVVVLALLAGVGLDVVLAGRLPALVAAVVTVVAAVAVVAPLVGPTTTWRAQVASGERPLPIDWPFPLDPGGDQTSTLARLAEDLRAGRLTVDQVGDGWGGTRTLAMLYMLDERNGRTPPLTPADVLAYYRVSEDCPPLDGTACSR